jgi:putative oxidoreductase
MIMATVTHTTHAWGTTLLRVVVGAIFVAHGAQKLFQFTPAGLAVFFDSIGIPFATANAYLVIAVELLGGLAMIAGFGTRIVAVLFASVMAVAFLTVHLPNGFFLPDGYEFVLVLFAASVTLALQGAGALAADNALTRRGPEPTVSVPHARAA